VRAKLKSKSKPSRARSTQQALTEVLFVRISPAMRDALDEHVEQVSGSMFVNVGVRLSCADVVRRMISVALEKGSAEL
jgi:hypothetical protein